MAPHVTVMKQDEAALEEAARALLHKAGMSVLDAALLAIALHENIPPEARQRSAHLKICHRVIRLGTEAYSQEDRTVTFRSAMEQSLQSRSGRRLRTLAEINQCCRRLARYCPELPEMPMRSITPSLCRELILGAYHTPTSQRKARRLLHAIFAYSVRHGWCSINPAQAVDLPPVCEKKIEALSLAQIRRLLATTRRPEHLACAPAVGLMLWAGIRPTELTRLRWADVRVEDHVIIIEACHSKTGGARQVTLHPVLIRWLRETAPYRLPRALIVPRAWVRRWRDLRVDAGFAQWNPDTLRHTFASYHLKQFENLHKLQIDMGHADIQLLRTRYLGMRGVTKAGAQEFWGEKRLPISTAPARAKPGK